MNLRELSKANKWWDRFNLSHAKLVLEKKQAIEKAKKKAKKVEYVTCGFCSESFDKLTSQPFGDYGIACPSCASAHDYLHSKRDSILNPNT